MREAATSFGNQRRSVSEQLSQILYLSKPVRVLWSSEENRSCLPLTRAEDIKAELSKDLSGSQLKVTAIK